MTIVWKHFVFDPYYNLHLKMPAPLPFLSCDWARLILGGLGDENRRYEGGLVTPLCWGPSQTTLFWSEAKPMWSKLSLPTPLATPPGPKCGPLLARNLETTSPESTDSSPCCSVSVTTSNTTGGFSRTEDEMDSSSSGSPSAVSGGWISLMDSCSKGGKSPPSEIGTDLVFKGEN